MTPNEMIALRKTLGLTQGEMGTAMGLTGRSYQRLEAGETPLRLLHTQAAERVALRLAVERRDPMLAPATIRREVLDLAGLILGDA